MVRQVANALQAHTVEDGGTMALRLRMNLHGTVMSTRIARCSCGELTATIEGEPVRVSVCHCLACQRRTGSVFGAQARFARSQVRVAGQGRDYTRPGDEGPGATFTFCSTCGSTMTSS